MEPVAHTSPAKLRPPPDTISKMARTRAVAILLQIIPAAPRPLVEELIDCIVADACYTIRRR